MKCRFCREFRDVLAGCTEQDLCVTSARSCSSLIEDLHLHGLVVDVWQVQKRGAELDQKTLRRTPEEEVHDHVVA